MARQQIIPLPPEVKSDPHWGMCAQRGCSIAYVSGAPPGHFRLVHLDIPDARPWDIPKTWLDQVGLDLAPLYAKWAQEVHETEVGAGN